jgi:glutathionylspermidine synthase
MRRLACRERDDWQAMAEASGVDFHTTDGARYRDERAFYAFTLAEIEDRIEAPTGEIDAMCLELCDRVAGDEQHLKRKPLFSREGANIVMVRHGDVVAEQPGPYGAEGFIRQALAPLPNFSGQYPVLGSWLVDHVPCGLSIREDDNPVTGNTSRFLPHAIL